MKTIRRGDSGSEMHERLWVDRSKNARHESFEQENREYKTKHKESQRHEMKKKIDHMSKHMGRKKEP